jgi:hypothetical protein
MFFSDTTDHVVPFQRSSSVFVVDATTDPTEKHTLALAHEMSSRLAFASPGCAAVAQLVPLNRRRYGFVCAADVAPPTAKQFVGDQHDTPFSAVATVFVSGAVCAVHVLPVQRSMSGLIDPFTPS